MESEKPASDHCGEADCVVCGHRDSLVATYEDLPGWMFVLTEVSGGSCEVVVFDLERRRCMEAVGHDARGILKDLRARVIEQTGGGVDRESFSMPDAVASF